MAKRTHRSAVLRRKKKKKILNRADPNNIIIGGFTLKTIVRNTQDYTAEDSCTFHAIYIVQRSDKIQYSNNNNYIVCLEFVDCIIISRRTS